MAEQKCNQSSMHARGKWHMLCDSLKNKDRLHPPCVIGRNFKSVRDPQFSVTREKEKTNSLLCYLCHYFYPPGSYDLGVKYKVLFIILLKSWFEHRRGCHVKGLEMDMI